MRHKERYSVSKAQRITVIFTTEKLTYSTVLYIAHYTHIHLLLLWGRGDSLGYTLHRNMHAPSIFTTHRTAIVQKVASKEGSLITMLYVRKFAGVSHAHGPHQPHNHQQRAIYVLTHVRAKAIRAPTATMKSRMFHMSRK